MMKRCKTLKNKLFATVLIGCGVIPLMAFNDATALVLFGGIGVPLFLARENWIV